MAASGKRKQEEKHLKMLRDMTGLLHNRPKLLRLRPARLHLREYDGRLLRVYLLLRQPARRDSAPTLHLNKGTPSQSLVVGRSQGQQQEKKQFDLLSDLGSDIFAAPAPQSTAAANFANFAHFNSHAGGSAASVNANFAHFDNFSKSSSADFGTFNTSQSHQTASAVSKVSTNKAGLQTADKYAALANLDNIFSAGQGGDQGSGFGTTDTPEIKASLTKVPPSSLVQECSFFVHMKSTLTKRGLHVKASGYKVIHVTGRLWAQPLALWPSGTRCPQLPWLSCHSTDT
ncbi:ArfGAP with FG repeats 1 [Saguinus oedipus]|uniref:ArfGAP with FG repeats 1 n=1 Tax=Saguinus oedipus TaxID=9490 RepID=A0ABQ9U7S9_SAGOE|nr:ArfGAP with FG repeats 1 [Saguinus oedipus]